MENKEKDIEYVIYQNKVNHINIPFADIIAKYRDDAAVQNLSLKEKVQYFQEKLKLEEDTLKNQYAIEYKVAKDHAFISGFPFEIFPDYKQLENIVSSAQYQKRVQPKNKYVLEQVPLHFKDNEWMKQFIPLAIYNSQFNREPKYRISEEGIDYYVNQATSYQAIKKQFEANLVGAQIKYMMKHSTPNVFMDQDSDLDFARTMPNYDRFFRNEVKHSLLARGFNEDIVENTLETKAGDWLQQTMIQAFENEYYPFLEAAKCCQQTDKWWNGLFKLKAQHQKLWLKRREYDYYQKHKTTIDRTKTATDNMKMNKLQVQLLDKKLAAVEKMYQLMTNNRKRRCILKIGRFRDKNIENQETQKLI